MARHGEAPPAHWSHRLAGLPWITLVLLVTLLVGGIEVLAPNSYQTQASVTAPDERGADYAAMMMADPRLAQRVEQEIELGQAYRGSVGMSVDHVRDDRVVRVVVTAPDPRLAALAADTAAVLVIDDLGQEALVLGESAQVPAEPAHQPRRLWVWAALVALVAAVRVEVVHRSWLRTHPAPPAQARR